MNTFIPQRRGFGRIAAMKSSSTLIGRFLDFMLAERRASIHTIHSYRVDLCQFQQFIMAQIEHDAFSAGQGVDDRLLHCEARTLQLFIAYLQKQGYQGTSVGRKVATLKSFHKYLVKSGLISLNPMLLVRTPKHAPSTRAFIDIEQLDKLLAAPGHATLLAARDSAILNLISFSGLRATELVALTLSDIDLEAWTVRISKNNSLHRTVPLPVQTVEPLRCYLQKRTDLGNGSPQPNDRVFLNKHNLPLNSRSVRRNLDKYLLANGLPKDISPRTLRQNFALRMLNEGTDPARVRELLGHIPSSRNTAYVRQFAKITHGPAVMVLNPPALKPAA